MWLNLWYLDQPITYKLNIFIYFGPILGQFSIRILDAAFLNFQEKVPFS